MKTTTESAGNRLGSLLCTIVRVTERSRSTEISSSQYGQEKKCSSSIYFDETILLSLDFLRAGVVLVDDALLGSRIDHFEDLWQQFSAFILLPSLTKSMNLRITVLSCVLCGWRRVRRTSF